MSGRVVGIGTGPGDPELVTLRAVRAVGNADRVVYVHAKDRPSRAWASMAPHFRPHQHQLAVALDMGTDRVTLDEAYEDLAHAVRDAVRQGETVAVLCEGDPLLYGTFLHLLPRLAGLPIEVVPGIPSAQAAAAVSCWPQAQGDESFAILPATMGTARLRQHLALAHGAAIIKVGRQLAAVRALLEELGVADGAVLAVDVSGPGQRLVRLADWGEAPLPYFALLLTRGLGGAG